MISVITLQPLSRSRAGGRIVHRHFGDERKARLGDKMWPAPIRFREWGFLQTKDNRSLLWCLLVQYGNEIIRQIRLTRIGDKPGRELLWGLGRVARLNDVVASQF